MPAGNPELDRYLVAVEERLRSDGVSPADINQALVNFQRRYFVRRLVRRAVFTSLILGSFCLTVGGIVFASVMFAESVPQVGFWQSLTIVVLFSQSVDKPCDRPLASWLTGLIALYFYWFNSLMPGPCSVHNLLARLLCCWRPRAVHIMTVAIAGRPVEVVRIARPRRVKLWDLLVVLLGVCWLCFGVSLVATADTCKETAAELYYSSKLLLIALVSLLLTWLLALIPPNIVQYGIWMGFWKT